MSCISHFSQFCIIRKLTESLFYSIIWIINDNAEQYWHQYTFLKEDLCDVAELTFITYEKSYIQIIIFQNVYLPSGIFLIIILTLILNYEHFKSFCVGLCLELHRFMFSVFQPFTQSYKI